MGQVYVLNSCSAGEKLGQVCEWMSLTHGIKGRALSRAGVKKSQKPKAELREKPFVMLMSRCVSHACVFLPGLNTGLNNKRGLFLYKVLLSTAVRVKV